MDSSHKFVPQQQFGDWTAKAKRKFVGATIHNSGQFIVAVMDHCNLYAFETKDEAEKFMEGHPQYRMYDLAQDPVPVQKTNLGCANIKSQSDYEDRQWERRQQRQAKAEA
jgi:hypothetical protein